MDELELVKLLRRRPGMFPMGSHPTFGEVSAYLAGLDEGSGALRGFREFLVLRADGGNNLAWPGLVLLITFGDAPPSPRNEDQEAEAVSSLLDLVTEFLAEGRADGRSPMMHEYASWVRSQSWYRPELQTMRRSPAPATMTVEETCAALGLTRIELFERLRVLRLHPLRKGADVVFRRNAVEELAEAMPPGSPATSGPTSPGSRPAP